MKERERERESERERVRERVRVREREREKKKNKKTRCTYRPKLSLLIPRPHTYNNPLKKPEIIWEEPPLQLPAAPGRPPTESNSRRRLEPWALSGLQYMKLLLC